MHVHANYSQQLASLGASNSTDEIAARRSAEVRKKLSIFAGGLNDAGDEIIGVRARPDEEPQNQQRKDPEEVEFGRFFSAVV